MLLAAGLAIAGTDNPNYVDAQKQLLNKIDVANYYTVTHEQPSTTLPQLQAVLDGVTADPASVVQAKADINGNLAGLTFNLTVGPDTLTGGTGADTFNALTSIPGSLTATTTFDAFDKLDGGKGNDTLNIFSNGSNNVGFPANATVTNIETININNTGTGFGAVDASLFVGATAINQNGVVSAVTNLGAGTTAGFGGSTAALTVNVTAAAAATSASVALNAVNETSTVTVTGTALNTVTISGSVVDSNADKSIANLATTINVAKDTQTLTLSTAVGTTLTVVEAGGSTKHVATLAAGASTGGITHVGNGDLATVTTGSGNDSVTLATNLSATGVNGASLSTGAGNDTLTIATTGGSSTDTVNVDAGAGNDTITIDTAIPNAVNVVVLAGAGNDKVTAAINNLTGGDLIDGGDGYDTVITSAASLTNTQYINLSTRLVNFEALQFTVSATLDAKAVPSTIQDFTFAAGGTANNVLDGQTLSTAGNLTATADGYVATKSYGGSLDITATAAATITANAASVDLVVDNGAATAITATLAGDVQEANVVVGKGDSVTVGGIAALTTLTLSGEGAATVTVTAADKLATVDASGLAGVLTYTSAATGAETIILGDGADVITLSASTAGPVVGGALTFATMDTIENFNVATGGDDLVLGVTSFTVFTIASASSVTDAVNQAAQHGGNVVFTYGGDAYVLGNGDTVLDATDILVKLVGISDTADLTALAALI